MSRRGTKVFPSLDLESLDHSPKLGRGNSTTNLFSTNDNSTEDEDNMSISSNRSAKKKKHSVPNNQANPSPRTPRSSFTPIQASMITSSPSPRQPRLSRQLSYQEKPHNAPSNHSNQVYGSTPPLRRAKSGLDDDTASVTSVTPSGISRKSTRKSTRKVSVNSISSKRKRVSFANPIIDPTPETAMSQYVAQDPASDSNDPDASTLAEEIAKRKERRKRRQLEEDDGGCGVGCIIT
mmetsp:Transcript_23348/g.25582  ORF Transcript_23348/g.25582 Transcript_23348/m.25582 type:complete len:236 (-) Transcript_23348:1380-2087(-)|eukprot:CAMPEP_0173149538 /NCGR_PEP_ID=MMETSP1105-20130129/10386_1 /TAXON_ID=2985 /ORGANISM="Ochromonas sp., Strain BG-1" /LENGTH=235 /DNA_ID=CAMNT_0014064425 /DNA_START=226 /DNA_END=933 /DNA_ORIENTATION=-